MNPLEWTGAASTVEDAVQKGLKMLGLTRDQVDMKIVGEKTSALFSLFGFRRVQVKLVEKPGARRERPESRRPDDSRDRGFRDRDRSRPRGEGRGNSFRRDGGRREESRASFPRDDRGRPPRERGFRDRDDRPRPPSPGEFPREGSRPDEGRRDERPLQEGRGRPPRERNFRDRDDRPRGEAPRDGFFRNEGRGGERPPRDDRERSQGDTARDDRPRREGPRDGGFRNDRPSIDRRPASAFDDAAPPRPSREIPAPDVFLDQWKVLLGWEDLSWSARNGENGDVTLVFDAASGDRLMADGGRLLESLDYLLNIVRSKGDRNVPRVTLRVDGQAAQGEQHVIDEALRAADEVKRTGESFPLEPMDARDRRLVHQTLAAHPDVETSSEGEGSYRKVIVKLKNRG